MTNQQPAELPQPGISSFNDPAALIASQFASILVTPEFVVVAVRHDQFNTTFLEPLTKRIRIIGRSAITRWGLCRGRPLQRGTRTWSSVASASVTSLGEALSSRTPSGIPLPSTSTIHFVPLPRLVLPIAEPPFSPVQNCRRERLRPTSAAPLDPRPPVTFAKPPAKHLGPPIASVVASRWKEKETLPAGSATPHRFAESTKFPRNKPGSMPKVARARPVDASPGEATVQSIPTVHQLTASVDFS